MPEVLTSYRFSFGPWNLSEGADPFGPVVRDAFTFEETVKIAQQLGFDALQFHDDDAVPDLDSLTAAQIMLPRKGPSSALPRPWLWSWLHTVFSRTP